MPSIAIDPEVAPILRIGVAEASPVRVGPAPPELLASIEATVRELTARYAGKAPGEIEALAPARRLFRAFGIDPTSTRPSSEALLRRVLQGKPFPRINAAVDVANLCSVSFPLPIGLYDRGAIRGEIVLRRGRPGESYPGIRKDEVHLSGRPTLVDASGPFGNPTSDSARTSVGEQTSEILMVVFAPNDYPEPLLAGHLALARGLFRDHLADPANA